MNKLYIFLAFIFGLISLSCKTAKLATESTAKEVQTAKLIQTVLSQRPVFTDLTIQSKINAEIDGNNVGLTGKIYVENGKKIWVNVSKFGITAARAMITPEGFRAYEILDRTFIDGDFSYFNQLLKVDFIDYEKLQNLLLGRIFVELHPDEFQSRISDNTYILTYKGNDDLEKNPKEGEYIQTYQFGSDFLLKSAYIKDPKSSMELTVDYMNWKLVGTQSFPQNVKILVKDKKTQQVELEYNNFTFQKSETPFEIPSGYKPNRLLK